jgi:hypothetical protein
VRHEPLGEAACGSRFRSARIRDRQLGGQDPREGPVEVLVDVAEADRAVRLEEVDPSLRAGVADQVRPVVEGAPVDIPALVGSPLTLSTSARTVRQSISSTLAAAS